MINVAVLADDFTGALDTCVQFSSRGIPAVMYMHGQWKAVEGKKESVMVLNLLTRHLSSKAAYEKVFQTIREIKKAGVEYVYLKTDSGLRGNIGSYLAGAMQAWENGLVFAPSYPDAGRIVRNGILYIDGIPVSESVFGKDTLNPVRHAHVADVIHEQAQIDVSPDYRPETCAVCLQDASTNLELLEIANRSIRSGYTLFAGCAAFASAFASVVALEREPVTEVELPFPVVAISGSRSPITVQQFQIGAENGFSTYTVKDILSNSPAIYPVLEAIQRNPDRGLLISIPDRPKTGSSDSGWISHRICHNLGCIARGILDAGFHGTLMIVGGDTLSSVSSALRIIAIRPLREIEPGVVVSQIKTENYGSFVMITKSGSLGSEKLFPLIIHETGRRENRKI